MARDAEWGPLREGELIDGCRVVGLLGRGGFGAVYRAQHLGLDQPRALKILLRRPDGTESENQRFIMEARHTARLAHPNIVLVHNVGEHRQMPFINMEFLDGASLRSWMAKSSARVDASLRVVEQVLRALARAHDLGIVHRDVKPDNVIVLSDGTVKVVDFGLSLNHASLTMRATQDSRRPMGTPLFMAPEQWASSTVGPAADVWSVGVMLYEMLVGRPPFQGDSIFELMPRVVREPHVPLDRARPGVGKELSLLVDEMLEKDPARRLPDAGHVLQRLSALPRADPVLPTLTQTTGVVASVLPPGISPEGSGGRRHSDGALMALIPGGEFTMGSDDGDSDERPAHRVVVPAFLIDSFPISRRQFATFLTVWGSDRSDDGQLLLDMEIAGLERLGSVWEPGEAGDEPLTGVTWYGASTYARWAGATLPTEEQLEYLMAWLADPEKEHLGANLLLGAIRHLTADTYDESKYSNASTSLASGHGRFVSVRGLSRFMNPFSWVRSQRQFCSRGENSLDLGFRCVMSLRVE